jgi:hypothetical protein
VGRLVFCWTYDILLRQSPWVQSHLKLLSNMHTTFRSRKHVAYYLKYTQVSLTWLSTWVSVDSYSHNTVLDTGFKRSHGQILVHFASLIENPKPTLPNNIFTIDFQMIQNILNLVKICIIIYIMSISIINISCRVSSPIQIT